MYVATIKEKNILALVKGSNVTSGVIDAGGASLGPMGVSYYLSQVGDPSLRKIRNERKNK